MTKKEIGIAVRIFINSEEIKDELDAPTRMWLESHICLLIERLLPTPSQAEGQWPTTGQLKKARWDEMTQFNISKMNGADYSDGEIFERAWDCAIDFIKSSLPRSTADG